jgi:hypothetical protein
MWLRASIMLSCILLLLVLCPQGFCQMQPATPVKGVLPVDSTGARATQIPPSIEPMRIGLPDFQPATISLDGYLAPEYTLPVTIVEPQVVNFHFSGTEWNWLVRKPGEYASNVLIASISSNGGVLVKYETSPLLCTDGSGQLLETHYASAPVTHGIELLNWMTPQELNNYQMLFDDPPFVPVHWAFWQKIVIDNSAKAAEFEGQVKIYIELLNNFLWLDSDTLDQYPPLK